MDPFVDALPAPGVERRGMFGRDALLVDGHVFAFLDGERLVVKLPPADAAALLASGDAEVPTMGSREMRAWVSVPLEGDHTPLITAAREHVRASAG